MRYLLLFLVLFLVSFASFGQNHHRCLTDEIRQRNLEANPEMAARVTEMNEQLQHHINNYSGENREVITLPIVVHVVWRTQEENISDDQILSQIDVLNEDFRLQNANFSNTPASFQSAAADTEIDFCLATVDPDGNATNGITRTQTNVNGIGNAEFYDSAFGGKTPWNNSKYINIWICDPGEYGTLGFATIPGTADPPESDGIVIAPQYFGTTGTAANSSPNNLGRTTTHEIGHFLNLEHLWGPFYGGCNEDDGAGDTPPQDEPTYGCPNFPLMDACTSSENGIMFMNYMDYSDDNCMTMFTLGQKIRMTVATSILRAGLLDGNVCSNTTPVSEILASSFRLTPNPAQNAVNLSWSNLNNHSGNVEIIDLSGKKVMDFKNINLTNNRIDVSNIAAGVYWLNFVTTEQIVTQKLVIVK